MTEPDDPKQKTLVITGGNSGLGYACAKAILIADQGWHVVIAGTDAERSAAAVQKLMRETGRGHVETMALNLASLASVRQFSQALGDRLDNAELPPLRAIVANAGVQRVSDPQPTEDGFEMHFGVNHLGHFLLVNLLLPHLAAPARIVFVSSDTHDPQATPGVPPPRWREPDALAWPDRHSDPADPKGNLRVGMTRYATSKLAGIYTAYELSRRLQSEGQSTRESPISVLAFGPGMVPGTGLARDHIRPVRFLWRWVLPVLRYLPINVHSPSTSGGRLARLVLDPALAGVTGTYFVGLEEKPSSAESYDDGKAAQLWAASARLVGLGL